jgi:peptidoglycan biosynthesis protein MviN/MurJ (putative lipid II flippase)
VTALLNASVLLAMLRRRLDGVEGTRLAAVFARSLAASLAMAAAAYGIESSLVQLLPGHSLTVQIARVGATITGAIVVMLAASWALGLHEINDVLRALGSRVMRSRRG